METVIILTRSNLVRKTIQSQYIYLSSPKKCLSFSHTNQIYN